MLFYPVLLQNVKFRQDAETMIAVGVGSLFYFEICMIYTILTISKTIQKELIIKCQWSWMLINQSIINLKISTFPHNIIQIYKQTLISISTKFPNVLFKLTRLHLSIFSSVLLNRKKRRRDRLLQSINNICILNKRKANPDVNSEASYV